MELDIVSLLKNSTFFNLDLGTSSENLKLKIGHPSEKEIVKTGEYWYYGSLRFHIQEGLISELVVLFKYGDADFDVESFIDLLEVNRMNKYFQLHKMVYLLNHLGINWSVDREYISEDYLKIKFANISVIYYLYTGELERISTHLVG